MNSEISKTDPVEIMPPSASINYADFLDQLRTAGSDSSHEITAQTIREIVQTEPGTKESEQSQSEISARQQQTNQPDYVNYALWFTIGALVTVLGFRLLRL